MARSFNGSTDQCDCGNTTAITTAVTLAAWFNCSALTAAYGNILSRGNTVEHFFGIFIKSTGKMAYFLATGGGSTTSVDPGTTTASTSVWNHTAMTYDSVSDTTLRGFLNGAADGTRAWSAAIDSTGVLTDFSIGYDATLTSNFFTGSIADAALWNVKLSAFEIAALAKGIRPSVIRPLSLVGYWPLDGLQSPEPDLSGNKFNGTLTGTAKAFGPPIAGYTPRWPNSLATPPPPPPVFNLMPQIVM